MKLFIITFYSDWIFYIQAEDFGKAAEKAEEEYPTREVKEVRLIQKKI